MQTNGLDVKRSTGSESRREAKVAEAQIRTELGAAPIGRRSERRLTLSEYGGLDVERSAAKGTSAKQQDSIEWQWGQIADHFGADSTLAEVLTADKLRGYVLARREHGARSPTIRKEMQRLRWATAEGLRRGCLAAKHIDWPDVGSDPVGDKRRGRLHPPKILARWLAELPQDARDEAELGALTGLRAGDLKRIVADWIEPLDGGTVPAILRMPPRGKRRRELIVPLVGRAFAILRRRAGETEPGTPLLHQGEHKTAYRLARERIGYTTPISLRDLRKTWGTLANRNVGMDAARDGLGHSNVSMTSRYVEADMGRVAEASLALERSIKKAPNRKAKNRNTKQEQGQEMRFMERAKGFEPSTLGLGSRPDDLAKILDHVSACKICQQRVLACSNLRLVATKSGTLNRNSSGGAK